MGQDRTGRDASGGGGLPSGLEVLVVTWMPALRRYSLSLAGEPQDAEDILQETFLEAQRAFNRFDRKSDFGAWLRGIARNVAARHRQKASRAARLAVSLEPRVLEHLEELYRAEEVADDSPAEALKRCLGKLAEADRELVRARYEGKADLAAFSSGAGRTLSWAKTRLMRLRWALADCVLKGLRRAEAGGAAP